MKMFFFAIAFIHVSAFAMIQTPAQESANFYSAVLESILADNRFMFFDVSKIEVGSGKVKAYLKSDKGECFELDYKIIRDNLGQMTAEPGLLESVNCKL